MGHYILDDADTPIVCKDLVTWAKWMERIDNRRVALDKVGGEVEVSTVFLSIDHSFCFDDHPHVPILWETMVFGGVLDGEQDRYATKEAALAGHKLKVDQVRATLIAEGKPDDVVSKWVKESA